MKKSRVIFAVAALSGSFVFGFVVWYWLFALLYAGVALVGAMVSAALFAIAAVRKRTSEYPLTFATVAACAGMFLGGWWVRAEMCEYAMIAESTRLVVAANAFKKHEGRFPHSARSLAPTTAGDRLLAWIAGDSVRYGGLDKFYWISRGGAIVGEDYSSERGIWEVGKR